MKDLLYFAIFIFFNVILTSRGSCSSNEVYGEVFGGGYIPLSNNSGSFNRLKNDDKEVKAVKWRMSKNTCSFEISRKETSCSKPLLKSNKNKAVLEFSDVPKKNKKKNLLSANKEIKKKK